MNRGVQEKQANGRLLGRVKNAFTSKNHDDQVEMPSKPRKPRRRPSLRVSFLERRRSSLIGVPPTVNEKVKNVKKSEPPSDNALPSSSQRDKRKSGNEFDHKNIVPLLDKNRSSFINEILGTTPKEDAIYHLGDVGKEEDMIVAKGFEESLVSIAQLKEMDHAFVQRSNGEWRYCIVVATSVAHTGLDPFIKFLVDDKGHTKEIPLRQWTKLIRLPAKTDDKKKLSSATVSVFDDHLESHEDLMLSSIAVDGNEESFARIRKYKSDPQVQTPKFIPMQENRRMSESCLPKPTRRYSSRRRQRVSPNVTISASCSRIPSDFGLRRDSGATVTTSRTSFSANRKRHSSTDMLKGSWRLSEKVQLTPDPQFDIKFNQNAFLAALSSINETSLPL